MYEVTSGIGPFNASYVDQFVQSMKDPAFPSVSVIPYTYSSVVHSLIVNSLFSTVAEPISCTPSGGDSECASYILSGGLSLTAPWTPPSNPDYPLVRIGDVPTVQIEFQSRRGKGSFDGDNCVLFGTNDTYIAAELCLEAVGGSIHAGKLLQSPRMPLGIASNTRWQRTLRLQRDSQRKMRNPPIGIFHVRPQHHHHSVVFPPTCHSPRRALQPYHA